MLVRRIRPRKDNHQWKGRRRRMPRRRRRTRKLQVSGKVKRRKQPSENVQRTQCCENAKDEVLLH